MPINKGDIVLVPFPFTDLSETKLYLRILDLALVQAFKISL